MEYQPFGDPTAADLSFGFTPVECHRFFKGYTVCASSWDYALVLVGDLHGRLCLFQTLTSRFFGYLFCVDKSIAY